MENDTISMRDYSRTRAVSYEAVRAQVARYKEQLDGHTFKEAGSKKIMLDDYAVKFLDKHRQQRAVIVKASTEETQREIERLQQQVEKLQAELFKTEKELINLHKNREKLIADNARNEALLLIADKEHDQLQQTNSELAATKLDLEISRSNCINLQQEIGKFKKTIFGLYKKD